MAAKKKTISEWETQRDLEAMNGPTFFGLTLDEEQKKFKDAILSEDKIIVFCDAKAGTGKTTISVMCAEYLYRDNKRNYDGIIYITAPVQEERMGFLPGNIQEKTSVYAEPFYGAAIKAGINPYISVKQSEEDSKYGDAYIECRPHNYLRGLTFENKIVIVDESQNCYGDELKKIITRCADNCKIIVIGHRGQCDLLKRPEKSGFGMYLSAVERDKKPFIEICYLTKNYRGVVSTWADDAI